MNQTTKAQAISQIDQILYEAQQDGAYRMTFAGAELELREALDDAREYGDDRVWVKFGTEICLPLDVVAAAFDTGRATF